MAYLAVLGAVLIGAMAREVNLLLMLTGLMAGPVLFSWRLAILTMRGLEVRRRMPQEVCAGDLLVVHVELANARRRRGTWAVVVQDRIERVSVGGEKGSGAFCAKHPPGRSGKRLLTPFPRPPDNGRPAPVHPAVYFPYVPAGQAQARAYRGRLNQRGRYRLGPMRAWSRFPFGLFRRTLFLGATDTLTVFPRLGRLTRRWVTRHHEAFEGTQRRERQAGRTQGDFYGVRAWQHGDSRRWVHWRASARHGTLLVRQFEQHRNRDVAVLVDLWQPEKPQPEHLDSVELAVSFAATLVTDLCRKGGSNLLVGTSGPEPTSHSGPASAALLTDVMERLALVEADSQDRLPALLWRALGEIEPGTEVVLLTTRPADLSDTQRFAAVWSDPARRAAARRIRVFNTAGEELSEYFRAE